jgi:hypothetical protein
VSNKTTIKWRMKKSIKRKLNKRRATKTKVLKEKLKKKDNVKMKEKDRK